MLIEYKGIYPDLDESVKVLEGAIVIGDTVIGKGSSLWFNSVVRGDVNKIRIGKYVNVQDLTMIHCTFNKYETHIGDNVVIGHGAVIHGCKIGSNVLVGMGAVIMDGAIIGDNSIIGGGALVLERKEFPANSLIVGSPAKVKRQLREDEISFIKAQALHYHELAKNYESK